jgi:hypothetical protein
MYVCMYVCVCVCMYERARLQDIQIGSIGRLKIQKYVAKCFGYFSKGISNFDNKMGSPLLWAIFLHTHHREVFNGVLCLCTGKYVIG